MPFTWCPLSRIKPSRMKAKEYSEEQIVGALQEAVDEFIAGAQPFPGTQVSLLAPAA
jgi:hypothetical protein